MPLDSVKGCKWLKIAFDWLPEPSRKIVRLVGHECQVISLLDLSHDTSSVTRYQDLDYIANTESSVHRQSQGDSKG